jgi:hypothetical protein
MAEQWEELMTDKSGREYRIYGETTEYGKVGLCRVRKNVYRIRIETPSRRAASHVDGNILWRGYPLNDGSGGYFFEQECVGERKADQAMEAALRAIGVPQPKTDFVALMERLQQGIQAKRLASGLREAMAV